MTCTNLLTRRNVLQTLGAGVAGALATTSPATVLAAEKDKPKNKLKQSASRWCYGRIPLEKLAAEAKKIGLVACVLIGGSLLAWQFRRPAAALAM